MRKRLAFLLAVLALAATQPTVRATGSTAIALVTHYDSPVERSDGKFEYLARYSIQDDDVNSGYSKNYQATVVTNSTSLALLLSTLQTTTRDAVVADADLQGYDLSAVNVYFVP